MEKQLTFEEITALGNALNVSFGKSSTKDKGYGLNYKLLPDTENEKCLVELRFETLVNFNPRVGLTEERKRLDKESGDVLADAVKHVRDSYKGLMGRALKVKEVSLNDPLMEHISMHPSLVRAKYYRTLLIAVV